MPTRLVFALFVLLPVLSPAFGEIVQSGTQLPVLLLTELSSKHAKAGDPVRCVLLTSVPSDEQALLPAGLQIRGRVREVESSRNRPARLQIDFQQIQRPDGSGVPISAQLREVDNARETVAADGSIVGLMPVHVRPSGKQEVLMAAMYAHPVMLVSFEAARLLRREMEQPAISLRANVRLTLELTAPLESGALGGVVLRDRGTQAPPEMFEEVVERLPLRAKAGERWSDQTNLLFAGTRDALDTAFSAAGWSRAQGGGLRSDLKTFLAVVDHREYSAAPVSLLTLEGRPPDVVYEKQTNTFSKRHHVRVWSRPEGIDGKPAWLAAATHDVGIVYSTESRHFAHRVEPDIDVERTLILDELRFAGVTQRFSLVRRPEAQRAFENATGDRLVSDGRIAVIVLREPAEQRRTSPPVN